MDHTQNLQNIVHHRATDMYLWAQNTMSLFVFQELYGELAEHLWNKFLESGRNFLNFLTRLDEGNKRILFAWIEECYEDDDF